MMRRLCTTAMVHCNNALWVPMPIVQPESWLLVVENHPLFVERMHNARCAPTKDEQKI